MIFVSAAGERVGPAFTALFSHLFL